MKSLGSFAPLMATVVLTVVSTACQKPVDGEGQHAVADTKAAPRIAYFSEEGGNADIYTIRLDGTDKRRLTSHPAEDSYPSFSPDGKTLLFESDRSGNFEIFRMHADGSEQIQLTNNEADDLSASWAPDGRTIVFVSFRDGETSEVYQMDADGSNQVRLTHNDFDDEAPHVSPDGKHILTESGRIREKRQIYAMNADGSDHRPLTDIAAYCGYPTWSPDAATITFDSDQEGGLAIFAMDADGTNLRRLGIRGSASFANWAPDGGKILFTGSIDKANRAILHTMEPDGSNWQAVTGATADEIAPSWNPADFSGTTLRTKSR